MKRKQIWFTSDWHIGHKHVLEFDKRPFKDLEEMHRQLIVNFNKQVRKEDLTYFLGDMVFSGSEAASKIIKQLNGFKILIIGNHDKGIQTMYNCGFDAVIQRAEIQIGTQLVTLSHCPLMGVPREFTEGMHGGQAGLNWHGENNKQRFSWENKGQFHLSGHLHTGPHRATPTISERQWDVGLPGNNYRPVHISRVESWIDLTLQKERDILSEINKEFKGDL